METPEKIQEAFQQALQAQKNSYSPYSNYPVGAALVSKDGTVFTGCNVENASYPATICSERVALTKAVSEGKREFTDIVVITRDGEKASPCGVCRQMLAEFLKDDALVWMANEKEVVRKFRFGDLLPEAFRSFEP